MRGLLSVWILLMPLVVQAGVYKCTDAAGKVSFQEQACAATETSSEIILRSAQVVHSEHSLPQTTVATAETPPQPGHSATIHPDAPGGANFCRKLTAQYNSESKKVVAACKRGRNSYCNQSAEAIERNHDRQWLRDASDAQVRNYERNNASGSPLVSLKEKIRLYSC